MIAGLGLWLALSTAPGCATPDGALARWRISHDNVLAPPPTTEEAGDTRGPLARLLTPERNPVRSDPAVSKASADDESVLEARKKQDTETAQEFDAAQALFDAGKYDEAEKAFSKIEKRQNNATLMPMIGTTLRSGLNMSDKDDTGNSWVRDATKNLAAPLRKKNRSPWGEKALYYLAESQYRQGKLVDANDSLVKLMVAHPGTKFRDEVVKREYEIAVTWLDAVDPNAPAEKRGSWTDHFNRRQPLMDVSGHALQVLEHVRHHDPDPNAPYGDDAVKRIADFHYQNGHWVEASLHYDQLISDHPKSEYLQYAYARAIDSKIKGYYGPDYDVSGLDKARQQIEQMNRIFPERTAETREANAKALDLLTDEDAEITYRRGEFYRQTGYAGAAEFCFGEVKARWPSSEWAKKAQGQLELIAKAPRKAVEPSRIMSLPGSTDPYANGMTPGGSGAGGMGGMGGMGGGGMGGMG